jgi:type I restriction enzyme M protein
MVCEKTEAGLFNKHPLPDGCRWSDLNSKSSLDLLDDYKQILYKLSTGKDPLGDPIHNDLLILAIYADALTTSLLSLIAT